MTKNPDLYAMLGIGRDAETAAIRTAYRSRAKKAHPDAGGSPEEFEAAQTAHLVLTDPVRRAQYDKTGHWNDFDPNEPDHAAYALIAESLAGVVQGDVDPSTADLPNHLQSAFRKKMQGMHSTLKSMERSHRRTEKLKGRFKNRNGEPNRLELIIDGQTRQIAEGIARIKAALEDHERAVEILQDYDFRRDAQTTSSFFVLGNVPSSAHIPLGYVKC